MRLFFYGTLCHLPLLTAVLGHEAAARPAVLPGHRAQWVAGRAFPMLIPAAPEDRAEGILADLTPEDVARLDFYEGGFAYDLVDCTVLCDGAPVAARVYVTENPAWQPGAPWRLADWQARWGDLVTATAGDVMALYGQATPAEVLARQGAMLVRGASRLRAQAGPAPHAVRRAAQPGDVEVLSRRQPYARFFAVEDYLLRFRRFDGTLGEPVDRAAFISGDAACVLPYDPVRDRVLLVEQFRPGPFARGAANPWLLEPIAGRVDPGETPEDAARREAVEEAGLTLDQLIPIGSYYPSPGAKAEYLYTFLGLCDLPDGCAGLGGTDEGEDIRAHLVSFDELQHLVASGEAENGPLLLAALKLASLRGELRQTALEAGGQSA